MKKFIIFLLEYYQKYWSPDHSKNISFCKFIPSCSEYAKTCFKKYNFIKACYKTIIRIIKCHPGAKGGLDLP